MTASSALLWAYLFVLGISLGAGIYESRLMVPLWRETPISSWPNSGLRFWAFVTTGPLTLLVLSNFWAANSAPPGMRSWWIASLIVVLVERCATFGYFIPRMVHMTRHAQLAPEDTTEAAVPINVRRMLDQWARLGIGRSILTFIAWLLAARVLAATVSWPAG